MTDRRDFIKTTLGVASGLALGQMSTAVAATTGTLPLGIVYTAENPGKWAGKVGGHLPKVSVEGRKVTITTNHAMTERHYIVRHTLIAEDGTELGEKTFYPSDEDAVSTFELPEGHTSKLYATSFCNKHDLWVTEFTV
ncbi:secreted protein [Beggiatoa sp. PS]|nr:secreted protein [Beggiatoa sp. PS]